MAACRKTPARAPLVVGQIVTCDRPFTSLIGAHFRAGDRFAVDLVGRSTRCRHELTGSVVWIQGSDEGSRFVAAEETA